MKKILLGVLMVCLLIPSVVGAVASEAITVSTTAIGITSTLTAPATGQDPYVNGVCTVETAQIRYRVDGDPTSSVGHIANAGDIIYLASYSELLGFKMIRTGSTDASVYCTVW